MRRIASIASSCGRRGVLVLLGASLTSCGFHLAGDRPLPSELHNVYVEVVDPYRVAEPPLETALQGRLRRQGANVLSHSDASGAVLRLSHLTEVPEVLSLGPDGKAVEYRLITQVEYELIVRGKVRAGPDEQRIASDYSFNAQQILPTIEETDQLRTYSQGQLAELILFRVEAELRQPESPDAASSSAAAAATSVRPAAALSARPAVASSAAKPAAAISTKPTAATSTHAPAAASSAGHH